MRQNDSKKTEYVLGHSDGELARLEHQGEIFRADTEEILRSSGLREGMRVLDIGCGVGDVAMIAARMVGPSGSVLGVDTARQALSLAEARASAANFDWVEFEEADITSFQPQGEFDALVGRFILMHLEKPARELKRLTQYLRPDGLIALIEMDIEQSSAEPELPLLYKYIHWIVETYRRVGVEVNMGSKLYPVFRRAGLTPHLRGTCRIESGPESVTYDFTAETLRALLPAMKAHGIADPEEVNVDNVAANLRAAAIAGDHCIFFPRIVGAWAQLTGAGQT